MTSSASLSMRLPGLFSLARARREHHFARADGLAESFATCLQCGVGRDVEFNVARNFKPCDAKLGETLRIRRRLRGDDFKTGKGVAREPLDASIACQRACRKATVDQRQRYPAPLAGRDQIRPHLGLHHDAHPRPEMVKKAALQPGNIVGEVD